MTSNMPVRLAIVGGGRGTTYRNVSAFLPEKVELVALCDSKQEVLERWNAELPGLKTYADFQQVLDDADIDAVVLATPMQMHARQAVQLMEAGKHVLCEVAAADSIEDCWELVETVEKTGLVYMMAENFCYLRMNLLVKNMVEQGAFGELTHAECGYIHDVRGVTHFEDGSLAWRGEMMRDFNGVNYPTHSLGPVSQWLGINRTDSFDYMMTIVSKSASQADYFARSFGEEHPGAKPDYWKQGDSAVTLIRTKGGVVVYLRNDFSSPRPWNYLHYQLQGTKGAFESGREVSEEPVAWLNSGEIESSTAHWNPLWDYAAQYEHPAWQKDGAIAQQASTLGEYFILQEFVDSILEKRAPAIDVYDSVVLSSIFPLSVQSAANNGETVKFPDFAKNKPIAVNNVTNGVGGRVLVNAL
jgi:predicted dehydrogenase